MTVSPNRPKFPGRAGAVFLALAVSVNLSAAALGQGVTTKPLQPPETQPQAPLAPAPVVPPKPLLPVQSLSPPTAPTSLAPTTAPKSEAGAKDAKSKPGLLPVKFDVEALDATDREAFVAGLMQNLQGLQVSKGAAGTGGKHG